MIDTHARLQVDESQMLSMLDDNPNGDFEIGGLDDVDFSQFLTKPDFDGNSSIDLNTDPVLQSVPVKSNSGNGNLRIKDDLTVPFLADCDKSDAVSIPDVSEDIFQPARTSCSLMPDGFLLDDQPPLLEEDFFSPKPTSVTWSPTTGLQPCLDLSRPVSAPPMVMYDAYDQSPLGLQYDQSLEFSGCNCAPPLDPMYDQSGPYIDAFSPYGSSIGNRAAPIPHPYQQTSISYPGSPTQPIDHAPKMSGGYGSQGLLRKVRQYHPSPSSDSHGGVAAFNYGQSMRQPPTSNPRKRAAPTFDDHELLGPKCKRTRDWVDNTNAARGLGRYSQIYHDDLLAHRTEKSARSVLESIGSPSSEVDIAKAVTLATRRARNPGRKNTIPQTEAVLRRNRNRRERYRQSLTPQKRKMYDLNASIAKGLIKVPSDDEPESDEAYDGRSD